MSKFIFPPQIQQLRSANAGQIALVDAGVKLISVSKFALAAVFIGKSVSLLLTHALGTSVTTADHTPTITSSFLTTIGLLATQTVSLSMSSTTEPLTATPTSSPVIGVATFTNVF